MEKDGSKQGTYTIRESKTNNSYQRTDKSEHRFEVREDGEVYAYDDKGLETILSFDNYVYRSDLKGTKIGDGDSMRFSYVPFKITSLSNGESHVVIADKNGFFTTKDRRTADSMNEDEDANPTIKINPFDDLLSKEQISKEDIESRAEEILMGAWFGTGESGTIAEHNPSYGALPYDVRRNEVKRYMAGETDVVVATDAIGMGLNLPIKRIVFLKTSKFDGVQLRDLTYSEVKQISGRAGRYGMFDEGSGRYMRQLFSSALVSMTMVRRPYSVVVNGLMVPAVT